MNAIVDKCGHDEGRGHDCAYVDWRNSLIPVAEGMADAECGEDPPRGKSRLDWSERWDAAYHRAMRKITADPFAGAEQLRREQLQ